MPAYQLFCLLLYQLPYPHTRYLFIVIFVHSSIFALIDHLSFVCLYVHPSIHPFAYLSVNPLPIPPFIHHCLASICPFILLLLFYLFIFFCHLSILFLNVLFVSSWFFLMLFNTGWKRKLSNSDKKLMMNLEQSYSVNWFFFPLISSLTN